MYSLHTCTRARAHTLLYGNGTLVETTQVSALRLNIHLKAPVIQQMYDTAEQLYDS